MDFEQIMEEHTRHLLQLAYFYTKNHQSAEDIVQDVFIQFYHGKYDERGQLRAYLARITINKCKDHMKSWHYRKMQFQEKWTTESARKEPDRLVESQERQTIGDAILTLKITYREPLILYYFEEMTLNEIGNVLHLPINTVKTRLRRAKEQLKPMLTEEWEVLLNGSN